MKKYIYLSLFALVLLISGSCNDDREENRGSEGKVVFKVSMSNAPELTTKASTALPEGWNPGEECLIELLKSGELVKSYNGISELPDELTLEIGNYTLRVSAGSEKDASFTDCYYEGEKEFSITVGKTEAVELTCTLKNVLATVKITDELKAVLTENSGINVYGNKDASLSWTIENNEKTGYFVLEAGVKDLSWEFVGAINGSNVALGNTISNVKSHTNYVLTFDYDESQISTPDGGVIFKLVVVKPTVDDDEIDYDPETIEVEGDGVDLSNPQPIVEGTEQDVVVNISTTTELTSFLTTVDEQTKTAFGLDGNSFDFMAMNSSEIAKYATLGIVFESFVSTKSDGNSEVNKYSLTIHRQKVKELALGEYTFDFSLKNEKGTEVASQLKLIITEELKTATSDILLHEVWAKHVTVRGSKLQGAGPMTFDYKMQADSEWTTVPATLAQDQTTFFAKITDLTPGTTYEFKANGGGEVKQFTTEEAVQMPNSNFEDWHQGNPNKTWYLFPENGEKFWDSGNKGSNDNTIAKANATTPSTNYAHGQTSVQMTSQYIGVTWPIAIGKFAAGSLFTGDFDALVNTSGAKLNWGKPFVTRPSKLRGWLRYESGKINYTDSKLTEELKEEGAKKDLQDKAHIFVALGDWEEQYKIDNSKRPDNLFDKNDEGVIAYGEWVQHDSTEGDDLIPFEIDIKYTSLDRIPTYIIVVCTSSKYGDFFTGSTSSTLWVDDFELIYE